MILSKAQDKYTPKFVVKKKNLVQSIGTQNNKTRKFGAHIHKCSKFPPLSSNGYEATTASSHGGHGDSCSHCMVSVQSRQ